MGIIRFLLHKCARRHHLCLRQLVECHAVVEIATGLGQDRIDRHAVEAFASFSDHTQQPRFIERPRDTVGTTDSQRRRGRRCFRSGGLAARLCTFLAIEHIGACDLVMAIAHQHQFDLVLNVFNMQGALCINASCQCRHDLRGNLFDGFMNAPRGSSSLAFDSQECARHRDLDLAGIEPAHAAVAADDVKSRRGKR